MWFFNFKKKVRVGKFIKYCSNVRKHAWYQSNVGVIRKPVMLNGDTYTVNQRVWKLSWWKQILLFIKGLWK